MRGTPWIFILLTMGTAVASSTSQSSNTTKVRPQRETQSLDRDRRLVPVMTLYLAQTYTNQAGERQSVLIPVQTTADKSEQFGAVPQLHSNAVHSPNQLGIPYAAPVPVSVPLPALQYQVLPRAVLLRLQEAGLLPTQQTPQPPAEHLPTPATQQIFGHVYAFKPQSPRPTANTLQQAQLKLQTSQKYLAPQLLRVVATNAERTAKSYSNRQPHSYTSTKLQAAGKDVPIYYKTVNRPINENAHKVYTVDVQRLRPRPQTQNKYTATKIYLSSTTASPYTTKVKFELEDARVPQALGSVVDTPVGVITTADSHTEQPSSISSTAGGLSEYLETVPAGTPVPTPEHPKPHVYYTHEIREEDQNQINYIPAVYSSPAVPEPDNDIQTVTYAYEEPKVVNIVPAAELAKQKPTVEHVLTVLKQTNKLPQNLTPDNIDGSIRTLALILERLQNEKKYQRVLPPKVVVKPKVVPKPAPYRHRTKVQTYPQPSGTSTPGRAGVDYPTYATIPHTKFDCTTQRYKGFFGDPDTHCQVWHYCDLNGGQASFLCPNGTIFSQVALTCDWWFNVKCATTSQLYVLNERLYKYILPFSPSFPEDYSGPLVDRYLTAKFKEMEAKTRLNTLKSLITTPSPETSNSVESSSAVPSTEAAVAVQEGTDQSFESEEANSTE